jgi:hypothetical protein
MKAFNRALTLLSLSASVLCVSACGEPGEPDVHAPEGWTDTLEDAEPGWLMNVHALAHDDRYAVGGTLEQGALFHFDGGSWEAVDVGVDVPLLNWIHGDDSGSLIAVGRGGVALHFDGAAWAQVETPSAQNLWGAWGASMDDVWAVGGDALPSDDLRGVILRWDGDAWTEMALPETLEAGEIYAWFKVWGSGPSDVYIVGQKGAVLHWDGAALTEIDVGTEDDLIAVWGTGPDRVALVGGRNNGIVARWDGADWTLKKMAPMPGFNGVWMRDPDRIHVGGNYGTVATLDFATLDTIQEVSLDTADDVHALHGSEDGVITAVGGNLLSNGVVGFTGIAYHRALGDDE